MGRPPLPPGSPGKPGFLQLTNGQWRARVRFRDYDGITRPIARYATTKTKADNLLKAAIADRQRGGGPVTTSDRVDALIDDWLNRLDETQELAVGTRQQYRKAADAYVKPALGAYRVAEINVVVVDRALRAINRERGYSVAKLARAVMAGVFGVAVRQGTLPSNPVRDTEPLRAARKEPRALTPEEANDLVDKLRASQRAVDLDLPDLCEFCLATGARIGEALAARDETLDLDAGSWLIDSTVIRVKGRGLVIQEHTKSVSGGRVLLLPPFAVDMLRRRRTEIRLRGPEGVVFGSPSARTLRDPSNCAGDLREVVQVIGYPWVTFHTFRKTVATMLDQAGQSPRQAADQLGHAKVSMTQDHYFGRRIANPDAARLLDR